MLLCSNTFATFMLITMVFMVCGQCGRPFNVKISILVVSKLTRLMRLAGLSGRGKGGRPVTTRTPKGPDLRLDLVNREFKAPGPGKLWAADITYVRTRKGFVYTAFVTDVFSRRIVG